jgi:beta-lactamase superfamily II metal-dependent hydrolase
MTSKLPMKGIVFWPVGNGDSTTICIKDGVIMQVDLNHLESASDEGDPRTPVVDKLVELLPDKDGKPYLSAFVLTHPDQDHCRGFASLSEQVLIGELWFTPRIFNEYKKDLCEDAKAFKDEAMRRVAKTVKAEGDPGAGNRIRVVGYDVRQKEEFEDLGDESISVPSNEVTEVDGKDHGADISFFIHSPFKDEADGERNDTSLGFQVTLKGESSSAKALLLGDASYPVVKKILDMSDEANLQWNIFLAPHHCSKKVLYWKDEGADKEELKDDLVAEIEKVALEPGHIVSSSEKVPNSNEVGDNPPHAIAEERYKEIAPSGFLCTGDSAEPIVFEVTSDGLTCQAADSSESSSKSLKAAVATARGEDAPPGDRIGFGS